MSDASHKIIQLSDTHVFAEASDQLLGVPTEKSFKTAIDLLKTEPNKFEFIIHSGDISQDGSEASYVRVAEMLKPFNVPVYCIPGNHDNSDTMAEVYPRDNMTLDRHIVLKKWQIILLDSHKPNAVDGYLAPSQLEYMERCLQNHPDHHAIIVFHHHPLPIGCEWLDNLLIKNADEFWQIIAKYPKVNTVLFGHVHQEFEQVKNGVKCYATPSTCIQFKPQQAQFGLDKLAPGYRYIELYDDGSLITHVKRSAEYVGEFLADATGY